jgi:hypothetical protein
MRGVFVTALLGLSLSGCIVEAPGTGENPRRGPKPAAVVSDVPPLDVKLGAILDDKVELVGAKLEPGRALPGETVKITAYYKVLEPVPQDYTIFVHVEDPTGKSERINLDHQPAGGTHPTSQWKKGETVADTVSLYVPPTANLRAYNIWVGFWHPSTDTRMELKNPDEVRNDGRNRILLATLPVGRP